MPMADSPFAWTRHRAVRRLLLLALFIGVLVLLRHLLVLLVFFVAFERVIGYPAQMLTRFTRMHRKLSVLVSTTVLIGAVAAAVGFGVGRATRAIFALRAELPERIAALRETALFHQVQDHMRGGAERIVDGAQHYAAGALTYVTTFGHMLAYALIGFILAIVFLLERDELQHFAGSIQPSSTAGTMLRWLGHVSDAVRVTLGFQIVVAGCNAVLTWPVLLAVGIPHATGLVFMIFFSGMVPVAGNFVAGAILTLLAYQAKGWTGVLVLTVLTFVLHKLESYYLNPRLAARHVRLPGFVLIVSLIVCEHLLGFVGLFVSFPLLFVAGRLRGEFKAEDEAAAPQPAQST